VLRATGLGWLQLAVTIKAENGNRFNLELFRIAVNRSRQAEIVAMRWSLVFRPEQTARLQLRDDEVNELVRRARQVGSEEDESFQTR